MKTKRLILLILFLGFLPFSCFKRERDLHFRVDNLTINSYKDDALNVPTASDTLNGISTYFKLNMNLTYIASLTNFDFSNSLYATSKVPKGRYGLSVKLNDIKIYSDKLFNGRASGANLKDLFSWHNTQWDDQLKSIDNLKDKLNEGAFFVGQNSYYVKLILNSKPSDSLSHHLTVELLYSDGTSQNATTDKMIWK